MDDLRAVSLATTYEIDKSFDSDKFIKMRLRVCHDGTNPNNSNFVVDDMDKAKDSVVNIPILAHVITDEDGNPQFGGHDIEYEDHKMKENDIKLIYKETPIGLVPETCNHEIKEYNGKNYVFVDAYIWREYSNYAEDIIERDQDIKLSMEILVDAYSYDGKQKVYNITEYRYQGITFLNKNYGTGMKDALATTGTFSEDESKQKVIMMMAELKNVLSHYDNKNPNEGGNGVDEKITALLEQYNVKAEELSFGLDGLSFEEIEAKLKEVYGQTETLEEPPKAEPEKFVKSFELSHEDIRRSLYNLLAVQEAEDNEWYGIYPVYDTYFEYSGFFQGKIYRQSYVLDGDNVSFEGDRIELFQERLTKEEKDALDEMRSKYSQLVKDFEEYKNNFTVSNEEAKRLQKFEKDTLALQRTAQEELIFEKYDELFEEDDPEYAKIKKDKANFSIDQLAKEIAFVYTNKKITFASKQSKIIKLGGNDGNTGEVSPYGNIIEKHTKNFKEDN